MPGRLTLPLLLLAAACAKPADAPKRLGVDGAWVRLPAVPGRPGAAYFTLTGGTVPAKLLSVSSERVASVELHESMGGGGAMVGMQPIAAVNVPPGAPVVFRPGGRHAMLFGIRSEVKPGDRLPLAFTFAGGTRLVASAMVVGAGDPAPGE